MVVRSFPLDPGRPYAALAASASHERFILHPRCAVKDKGDGRSLARGACSVAVSIAQ